MQELERLKNEPDFIAPQFRKDASSSFEVIAPSIATVPSDGKSIAPHKFSNVDLPQPLRPMSEIHWPSSTVIDTS